MCLKTITLLMLVHEVYFCLYLIVFFDILSILMKIENFTFHSTICAQYSTNSILQVFLVKIYK